MRFVLNWEERNHNCAPIFKLWFLFHAMVARKCRSKAWTLSAATFKCIYYIESYCENDAMEKPSKIILTTKFIALRARLLFIIWMLMGFVSFAAVYAKFAMLTKWWGFFVSLLEFHFEIIWIYWWQWTFSLEKKLHQIHSFSWGSDYFLENHQIRSNNSVETSSLLSSDLELYIVIYVNYW